MNIAKALKTKNSLVKSLREIGEKIRRNNSSLKGMVNPYDTKALYLMFKEKQEELLTLKAALNKANIPIQGTIYRLTELKSEINWLKGISTQEGKTSQHSYGNISVENEFIAQITTLELEKFISDRETELETLQEEVDKFNYTTEI